MGVVISCSAREDRLISSLLLLLLLLLLMRRFIGRNRGSESD
jgi:hypothetical protein